MTVYYTYDNLGYNGRLGNMLWQIAATIGRAHNAGGVARFNPNWEYRQFFSVPDEFFESIDCSMERVDGETDYFQELSYWKDIDRLIRMYFTPSDKALAHLSTLFAPYDDGKQNVSVHVRRGDYVNLPGHFPLPTQRYFHSAVSMVEDDLDGYSFLKHGCADARWLVFSDDPDWCRANLEYLGLVGRDVLIMQGTPRPVEVVDRVGEPEDQWDMFLMSLCDHHIISNSTFSWWGAWLAMPFARPIYPSKWFGSKVPNWERWGLGLPADWRMIEC